LAPQSRSLSLTLSGPAPTRPADRTLSSYATPVRGDVIEWIEPEQQAAHSVAFVGGSSRLSRTARDTLMAVWKRLGAEARVRILVAGADNRNALTRRRVEQVRQTLIDNGVPAQHIGVESSASAENQGWRTGIEISVQWRAPGRLPKASPPARDEADTGDGSAGRPVGGNFDILAADRTVSATMQRWARQSGYQFDWTARIDAPIRGELTLDTDQFPEAARRVIAGLRASGYPLQLDVPSERMVRVVQTN